ncbi:MAG: mannose-6-phosphate isomerase, class I [Pontimonas sp.]|nr:mannose-6-phosphate isomerase, class I [Pontimonas sp.]
MFARLRSVPKNYDWGTPNAMSALQGLPPTNQPEAELWFGSHPASQCTVDEGGEHTDFSSWLHVTGHDFPLLVKFLAASRPLSIQVHPHQDEAAAGFERENAEGLALDSPQRTYKDGNPKPELLIALSDSFDALWGLLPSALRTQRLQRCAATGLSSRTVEGLAELSDQDALATVLAGGEGINEWAEDLGAWSILADSADSPEGLLEREIFARIAHAFPGDRGIVVAFLMHTLRLTRGEALFVSPGQIHAYVGGFALEVMLPSDNVVRGGLTSKHQDAELFLNTATAPAMDAPPLVLPVTRDELAVYDSPAMPFSVSGILGDGDIPAISDALILGETGEFTLSRERASRPIRRGEVYFVEGNSEPLQVRGQGTAWLVEPRGN